MWVRFGARTHSGLPQHTINSEHNQWGDGTLHMGSIRGKAHRLPDNAHSNGQHFSGAMEEMSRTVQAASAHIGAHLGASTAPVGLLGASRTLVIALPAEDK